jgi:hypothetical protein
MSVNKRTALTYEQAINTYFDGAIGLSKQPFPWKCKCGDTTYYDKDDKKDKPIMNLPGCFAHVRRAHKEKIKTPKAIARDEEKGDNIK